MLNDDLIAVLHPSPTRWAPDEWRDVCDAFTDIRVDGARFTLRALLPKGLYRCRIEMKPGSFDMDTATIPMVQVPDGQRVPVGPWDLNHIDNYMAMPMAKTYVNGHLLGGLWFEMPGYQKIAEGRLAADFGFEVAADGETELVLEFVENARERIRWSDVQSMEFRTDNRTPLELLPVSQQHPRIFVSADELAQLKHSLPANPLYQTAVKKFQDAEEIILTQLDVASFVALVSGDQAITAKVKKTVLELCALPSWKGRPDPLLMGGDNDRGVGFKMFYAAAAWEYLRDAFSADEQQVILAKLEEYLQKMYDFTVLQRAYMGHPTTEPHSLGTWFGVGLACMAFYDELPIARKALPFFHGLFVDSLKIFPAGGKMAWVTFFPLFMVRYIAMAHTFGGFQPALDQHPFLDNLAKAMLACYETPNTQEMQRGQRTIEHRQITSFLCRFHPTEGIESVYQAFYESEMAQSGNVEPTLFDLLYAPSMAAPAASFPTRPLFVRDTGDIIGVARGEKTLAASFAAGLRAGGRSSYSMMPHNRCFPMPLGEISMQVDGTPVLVNIDGYGLTSATRNNMCFNDGGIIYQGQYLLGEIEPEKSPFLRRCLLGNRFIYAHAVITEALHPSLDITTAERIFLMDYRTGVVLLYDLFEGAQSLRFSTHLHCAGSVTELGPDRYRLTGGQARTIAAPGRSASTMDSKLTDDEQGEIFIDILKSETPHQVMVEEPTWCPPYIYGLNNTGKERIEDARFPRYKRWRLEAGGEVARGSFLFSLSADAGAVSLRADGGVALPQGGIAYFAGGTSISVLGCTCSVEAAVADEPARQLVLLGVRQVTLRGGEMRFTVPVDIEVDLSAGTPHGTLFSPVQDPGMQASGVQLGEIAYHAYHPRSRGNWLVEF
ncbi:MAG: hypothetical protein ACYDBB_20565 [Armatimonadota bacterium]